MHKISLIQRSSDKHKPFNFLSDNEVDDGSTKKETYAQGEVSPEDFIDLDEEVDGQVNDYGDDYDEEDDNSPSPQTKKGKEDASFQSRRPPKTGYSIFRAGESDRYGSPGSSENTSRYHPEVVANQMLARKERKIPHSVFKPHSDEVILLHSA